MPEVPRDPRQLARDILSGKISIEDLAREQQRRRAAGGGAGVPVKPPVPQGRAPLPRAAPVQQRPRVVIQPSKPAPVRPAPMSPPRPQQRPGPTVPQQRRPVPPAPVRGPQIQQRMPSNVTRPATFPPVVQQLQKVAAEVAAKKAETQPLTARNMVRNREALRQSMLMVEILGKPLALREEW